MALAFAALRVEDIERREGVHGLLAYVPLEPDEDRVDLVERGFFPGGDRQRELADHRVASISQTRSRSELVQRWRESESGARFSPGASKANFRNRARRGSERGRGVLTRLQLTITSSLLSTALAR